MRSRRSFASILGTLVSLRCGRGLLLMAALGAVMWLGCPSAGAVTPGVCAAVATVEPERIEVGGPVLFRLDIASLDESFTPPSPLSISIPDWEVVEAQLVELEPQGEKRRWRYVFYLVSWQSGEHIVPAVEFGAVHTSALRVEVCEPSTETQEINPVEVPASAVWEERWRSPWLAGGLVAGAALGGAFWLFMRRFWENPHRLRRQRWQRLVDGVGQAPQPWNDLELVVREYLSAELALDEEGLTLEELRQRALSQENTAAWAEILPILAAVKYAPDIEGEDVQAWAARVRQWLADGE